MSGGGVVTNLEEFFLSRQFGHFDAPRRRLGFGDFWGVAAGDRGDLPPPVPLPPPAPLDYLFRSPTFGQLPEEQEDFPLDMNKPIATVLAFTPQTPVGRQRALAAVGGIAAAALVVVGVTSGTPHGPGAGQNQQALARNGGAHLPPLDAPPSARGASHSVAGLLAAERGHVHSAGAATSNATSGVHGSFSVFVGAPVGPSPSGGSARPSGGASGSGATSVVLPLPAVPNPVATVLDPVTQLTGNATSALSSTTQQINAVVPAAAPITGMVSDVGTTVSGLSGTLAGPNA